MSTEGARGRQVARPSVLLLGLSTALACGTGCGEPFEALSLVGSSCREMLAEHPSAAGSDRIVTLTQDGQAGQSSVQAWCDMTTAGGGWTLIARSVRGVDADPWGWLGHTGDLEADDLPYAFDLVAYPISFHEILFGDVVSGTKHWGSYVYTVVVPEDLLSAYGSSAMGVAVPSTVKGDCFPAELDPLMLRYVGFTDWDGLYYFRDVPEGGNFGLNPYDGWSLADAWGSPTCDRSGRLHGKPGMLMVR